MRKLYTSAARAKCIHSGATSFSAGRAVYQVLHARGFARAPPYRSDDSKPPEIRWYEQTTQDKTSIRPYGSDVPDDFDKSLPDEKSLDALERQLRLIQPNDSTDLTEDDLAGLTEDDLAGLEDMNEEDLVRLLEEEEDEDGSSPDDLMEGEDMEALAEDEADLPENPALEEGARSEQEQELYNLEEQFEEELSAIGHDIESLKAQDGEETGRSIYLSANPGDSTQSAESQALEYQRQLQVRAQKIQQELGELRESMKQFNNMTEESLQKNAKKSLEKNPTMALALQDENESEAANLEMEFRMPQVIKKQIKDFNTALRKAVQNPTHIYLRRTLWMNYVRCQRTVPGFLEQVSEPAWRALWDSQSSEPFYDEQAGHLLVLAENMRQARRPLSGVQKILCIKAYEKDGRLDEASELWQAERRTLQKDKHLRFEFNALGVALECRLQRPDKAEAIAFDAIARDGSDSGAARLMFPVIGAWVRQGSETSIKRAWGLYIYARQQLSRQPNEENRMTTEDHDEIFLSFFDAGRRDMALMVFKDLILTGQNSRYDSASLMRSMGLGLERMHANLDSPEQLNKISLEALAILPKRFENKYFYASWMKRLIGMGRIDAAVSVVELMYERGVPPDAKHLNGIIGFWLRQGSQEEQDQALDLAWSMVEERLRLVETRYAPRDEEPKALESSHIRRRLPTHLNRRVPRATTETFCLLLLYYTNKRLTSQVEEIRDLLSQAELAPNSYFMNHLMLSYSNQKQPIQAWDLFTKMSTKTKPDISSFEVLWSIADKVTTIYEQMDKFPGPRRLFSTMTNWYSQLPPKEKERTHENLNGHIYNQVVRAFCNWKDLNGTLVALYAMRDTFGLYPDEQTIRSVLMQVAHAGETRQAGHPLGRPRRRRKKPVTDIAKNTESAGRALEMLFENRTASLAEQNVVFEHLGEQQKGEERLFLLAEFLRAAQRQLVSANDTAETQELSEEFDKVAWEMGAGPFRMGPPVYDAGRALEARVLDVR